MKHILVFFLFIPISLIFSYQPTIIQGFVLNDKEEPIENVYIYSNTDKTYSKKDGSFIILYKNKNENVSFSRIGYEPKTTNIETLMKSNEVLLQKESIKLNNIKISGLTGDIKKHYATQDVHIYTNKQFKSGDTHFESLLNKIPNFNVSGATSRPRYFQIRGIGERSQYAGEGGPIYYVGTVIDDIDMGGIGMPIFLDDVKQIEIYQGPQSYAYGHNAMAGIVNIKTLDPSTEQYNKIKTTFGNHNKVNISNYNNLGDLFFKNLYINSFIQYNIEDGYIYNEYLQDYTNNKNELSAKIKLLYKKPNFFQKLSLIHANLNNGYDAWSPNNNGEFSYSNEPGKDSQKLYAGSLKSKISIGNWTLLHIGTILHSNLEHNYDGDWGNNDFWANPPYNYEWDYEYYQQELRERKMNTNELRVAANNFINQSSIKASNTFGLYMKNILENDDANGWILGGEDVGLLSQYKINNYAIFNELKINIYDLSIILNGRLELINTDYEATHYHEYYIDYDYYNPIYDTTYIQKDIKNNLWGGRVSLLYSIDPLNNIYLTLSNGFKGGGINQNPRLSIINQSFSPEQNTNIDLGYRYTDNVMSFNLNLFYMNRDSLQVNLSSQQDENPNSFYFYTANASKGYNYGLNLDCQIIPDENLESYLNLGLLNTNINGYEYMVDTVTTFTNPDREAAHAPSYTFSAGFTKYYDNFYLGGNIEGKDKFYFSDSHNQVSEPYSIANLYFGFKLSSKTDISIWSKNIFNKKYAIRGFYFQLEPPDWQDKLYLMYGEPFTIGLTIKHTL